MTIVSFACGTKTYIILKLNPTLISQGHEKNEVGFWEKKEKETTKKIQLISPLVGFIQDCKISYRFVWNGN